MQIEVTRQVTRKETMEVDFPYYYTQYLDLEHSNSTIYGRIELKRHITIHLSDNYYTDGKRAEIEIEDRNAGSLGCYFTDEHASNEAAFLKALEEAHAILSKILTVG